MNFLFVALFISFVFCSTVLRPSDSAITIPTTAVVTNVVSFDIDLETYPLDPSNPLVAHSMVPYLYMPRLALTTVPTGSVIYELATYDGDLSTTLAGLTTFADLDNKITELALVRKELKTDSSEFYITGVNPERLISVPVLVVVLTPEGAPETPAATATATIDAWLCFRFAIPNLLSNAPEYRAAIVNGINTTYLFVQFLSIYCLFIGGLYVVTLIWNIFLMCCVKNNLAVNPKSRVLTLVLYLFAPLGLHKLYLGSRWWIWLLYIITVGLLGIWWIIDGFALPWLVRKAGTATYGKSSTYF